MELPKEYVSRNPQKIEEKSALTSLAPNIISEASKLSEDVHQKVQTEFTNRSADMGHGKTRLFTIQQTADAWKDEKAKIKLIACMIDFIDVNAKQAENLVIIDNIQSLPAACPRCGAPIEDKYCPICTYCHRGVTHMEKAGTQATIEVATPEKTATGTAPMESNAIQDKSFRQKIMGIFSQGNH